MSIVRPGPEALSHHGPSTSSSDEGQLYGHWYYDTYTVPYEENEHWKQFFGQVAAHIVGHLAPETVLDAGCAKGFLVAALRERGVDACGFDISEVAIGDTPEAARPHVRVGSLTNPIEGHYDLITCIEVIEHLDPTDAALAVANLCAASDRVLLSSTPGDQDEATHVNVQQPERWAQLFATQGFYREFHHEASYLSPWAVLYRRDDRTITDVVVDYTHAWAQLRSETIQQRRSLLDIQRKFEESRPTRGVVEAERERLNKEMLRLRETLVGTEAELGTILGRNAEMRACLAQAQGEQDRLKQILASRSWRLVQALGTPVRLLRRRR